MGEKEGVIMRDIRDRRHARSILWGGARRTEMATELVDVTQRVELAEESLARLIEWVGLADTKASICLGVVVGMLGLLVAASPPVTEWGLPVFVAMTIATGALGASLVLVLMSVIPRRRAPSGDSLVFFGTIARHSAQDFAQSFKDQSMAAYLDDLLFQCHASAAIVSIKFAKLRQAYVLLGIAVIPWVGALYLFGLAKSQV